MAGGGKLRIIRQIFFVEELMSDTVGRGAVRRKRSFISGDEILGFQMAGSRGRQDLDTSPWSLSGRTRSCLDDVRLQK